MLNVYGSTRVNARRATIYHPILNMVKKTVLVSLTQRKRILVCFSLSRTERKEKKERSKGREHT